MKHVIAAFTLLFFMVSTPAAAQGDAKAQLAKQKPKDFPSQPIEFTVVYPAGGGMDVTGRLLAKYVEKWSAERIIVNNRTGGAGMIGHSYLATQAKPDGHTVGVLANLVWGDAMLRAQGRWSLDALEPIGYLNTDALTWVGRTEGPYKGYSVKQIVQAAKDKPGTVRVPFQGGGAGISALVGGNVDIAQGFYSEFRGHLDGGKVAPLAVAAGSRMDFLKDMPTFNEALGGNEYIWQVIRFAVVPKDTPAERKAWLGAAIRAAMQDPELIAEYKKFGVFFDPKLVNSNNLPRDLGAYAEAERQFYLKTGRLK